MTDKLWDYEKELDSLTNEYYETCRGAADAKQVYQRLDDLKKTKLAKEKFPYYQQEPRTSQACLEMIAYKSNGYEEYLEEVAKIRKEYYISEAHKEATKNRIDALITLISLEKEKMRLGHG